MSIYSGRTVLVTGATKGIGAMLVEYFLQHGAVVVGLSRGMSSVDNANYHHIVADVGNVESVKLAFCNLRSKGLTVDILINNAAVLTSKFSMFLSEIEISEMLSTNLLGTICVTREATKLMARKRWGRVVNVTSMAVALEPAGDSVYAASKSAIVTFSNVLSKEFSKFNITFNSIGVSAINTQMLDQLPAESVDSVIQSLPIPRYAKFNDISNVIDFFCSERSDYITSQVIYLGGVH